MWLVVRQNISRYTKPRHWWHHLGYLQPGVSSSSWVIIPIGLVQGNLYRNALYFTVKNTQNQWQRGENSEIFPIPKKWHQMTGNNFTQKHQRALIQNPQISNRLSVSSHLDALQKADHCIGPLGWFFPADNPKHNPTWVSSDFLIISVIYNFLITFKSVFSTRRAFLFGSLAESFHQLGDTGDLGRSRSRLRLVRVCLRLHLVACARHGCLETSNWMSLKRWKHAKILWLFCTIGRSQSWEFATGRIEFRGRGGYPVQWTVRGYLAVRPNSVRSKPSKLTQSWGHTNDLHSQFGIAEIVVSSRWKGPMFKPFPIIYFELMTTCCSMIHGHCPSVSFHADSNFFVLVTPVNQRRSIPDSDMISSKRGWFTKLDQIIVCFIRRLCNCWGRGFWYIHKQY